MNPNQSTQELRKATEAILVKWGQQCYNHSGTEHNKQEAINDLERALHSHMEVVLNEVIPARDYIDEYSETTAYILSREDERKRLRAAKYLGKDKD